jgi:tRNA(Arg) A34 adenosine deaminase TadA
MIMVILYMASDKKMLHLAAMVAGQNHDRKVDNRSFLLGAVGRRNDDVLVSSRNIAAPDCAPGHHAETRLIRKLTPGSTVWVARITRKDGSWALARPCYGCEMRLRGAGVKRVVYTIGPNEWGVLDF